MSNLEHRNKKVNDIHEGKWNGLGGKFEMGETPEECVQREVLEESGLTIQNPRLHGLLMFTNFKGNDWYVFVYTATEFTGELIDSPEGKLEWIPDEKLTSLNLWESDHIFFPWIEEGKLFSAKFEYDGDEMRAYDVIFHSWRTVASFARCSALHHASVAFSTSHISSNFRKAKLCYNIRDCSIHSYLTNQ